MADFAHSSHHGESHYSENVAGDLLGAFLDTLQCVLGGVEVRVGDVSKTSSSIRGEGAHPIWNIILALSCCHGKSHSQQEHCWPYARTSSRLLVVWPGGDGEGEAYV